LLDGFVAGKTTRAQLLIRHPNFNGMQMNQLTRMYTPARFIQSTEVTYNGVEVFNMQSDISLATDPAITFGFVPQEPGQMKVVVRDSKNTVFDRSFDLPASGT
ncbi:MAG: thiosulfate oxidation carrier complex protein SoxZ, partial [Pseudomonadota bacterium]|nr:thiosulfate oxidation carrier complex protein SoxZ [Pseudomonadota bacterium]